MARVLLVDDSMYQRNKLRKILEAAGYEVIEGSDGEEGLSMAASDKPDCMMLDLIMPKVGGMEVLQELHEKHVTIPVIIHTSDIQGNRLEDRASFPHRWRHLQSGIGANLCYGSGHGDRIFRSVHVEYNENRFLFFRVRVVC